MDNILVDQHIVFPNYFDMLSEAKVVTDEGRVIIKPTADDKVLAEGTRNWGSPSSLDQSVLVVKCSGLNILGTRHPVEQQLRRDTVRVASLCYSRRPLVEGEAVHMLEI